MINKKSLCSEFQLWADRSELGGGGAIGNRTNKEEACRAATWHVPGGSGLLAEANAGRWAGRVETQGWGYGAQLQIAVLRWQGCEGCQPERLSGEEKCGAGVLHFRLYRRLNGANEKLPAESAEAGSSRHPGPG